MCNNSELSISSNIPGEGEEGERMGERKGRRGEDGKGEDRGEMRRREEGGEMGRRSTCDFPGKVRVHGVYFSVEVFSNDLFLLLRCGLS